MSEIISKVGSESGSFTATVLKEVSKGQSNVSVNVNITGYDAIGMQLGVGSGSNFVLIASAIDYVPVISKSLQVRDYQDGVLTVFAVDLNSDKTTLTTAALSSSSSQNFNGKIIGINF